MKASIKNNVLTIATGIKKKDIKAAAEGKDLKLTDKDGNQVFVVKTGSVGSVDTLGMVCNSTSSAGELMVVVVGGEKDTAESMRLQYGKAVAIATDACKKIAANLKAQASVIEGAITIESDGEETAE